MRLCCVDASAVGTTVLQLKEIPPRPAEYDGVLCLFGVADTTDQPSLEEAVGVFGTLVGIEMTGPLRRDSGAVVVRFVTHEAALAAKAAGPVAGLYAGIDTLYNERSYDGRKGEAGREDDEGRGW